MAQHLTSCTHARYTWAGKEGGACSWLWLWVAWLEWSHVGAGHPPHKPVAHDTAAHTHPCARTLLGSASAANPHAQHSHAAHELIVSLHDSLPGEN